MNKKFKLTWKKAFFSLFIVNLLILIGIIAMIFLPTGEKSKIEQNLSSKNSESSLLIEAKKDDLNKLINQFIEKENTDGTIDYKVLLTDQVELYGTLPIFDQDVEMKLTFDPKALDNGDIILTQNTASIGKVQLPTRYILNFIKKQYHFPKWVEIFPNEKMIYIHLTEVPLKDQFHLQANNFDLKDDDISFSLIVDQEK